MDILDAFRGEISWRKLRVLIDHLPSDASFYIATMRDEDLALEIAKQPMAEGSGPSLEDWSPTVRELVKLQDLISELIISNYASTPGAPKPPKLKPQPRPKTALDKARHIAARETVDGMISDAAEAQARRDAREGSQ